MHIELKGLVRASALVGLLALNACPNPNIYGTPRTTPAGKVSHSLAAEVIGARGGNTSLTVPTAPTYTLRVGATDDIDIGVRIANLSTLGVDGKWNFVKSPVFDMAIDPGAQVFYYSTGSSSSSNGTSSSTSISGAYLHLPLLFGLNVSEAITLVPTAGIMYGSISGSSTVSNGDSNDSVKASANTGVIGRFGFGANFRISNGFAMDPELTVMKSFKSGAEGVLYLFGLGFNFGALPSYADVK